MRPPLSNFVAAIVLVLIGWYLSTQPGEAGGVSLQTVGYGIIGFAAIGVIVVSSDIKVTSESGGGRIRADIEVGKDVVIELKPNFDSTSKLQQLIGQIELYKREFRGRKILVVLVGDTDRNTLQHLEDAVSREERVRIIKKGLDSTSTNNLSP